MRSPWGHCAHRSRQSEEGQRREGTRIRPVDSLEIVFTGLLVFMSLVIVWFAGLVLYKLFKGQA